MPTSMNSSKNLKNTSWSRLRRTLSKAWSAPLGQKWMIVEAVWELAIARALVRFGTFKKWKHRMGTVAPAGNEKAVPQPAQSAEIETRADELGIIVRAVARRMPFTANCLPQASAAQVMLKRRGILTGILFLGGRKGDEIKPMHLHAWLYVGTICVTGDDGPGDLTKFTPLMKFNFPQETS